MKPFPLLQENVTFSDLAGSALRKGRRYVSSVFLVTLRVI